jgi:hypothetical protein
MDVGAAIHVRGNIILLLRRLHAAKPHQYFVASSRRESLRL